MNEYLNQRTIHVLWLLFYFFSWFKWPPGIAAPVDDFYEELRCSAYWEHPVGMGETLVMGDTPKMVWFTMENPTLNYGFMVDI